MAGRTARRRPSRRGFSLMETLICSVILLIGVLGNAAYRYQSILCAKKADMWKTAAGVTQLLCQSWAGVLGADSHDPVSALSPEINITAGVGPGEGPGFTRLGSYEIVLNGVRYFATLSWNDVQPGLRALNVKTTWSPLRQGDAGLVDADKSFALTAYCVSP